MLAARAVSGSATYVPAAEGQHGARPTSEPSAFQSGSKSFYFPDFSVPLLELGHSPGWVCSYLQQ